MTIDDALNHPWLNPQETMDLIDGEAQRNLKKIELSTENHKDYLYRTRNKNKEFDLLPIGCLARDSAIFRREGDKGILARELVMEMPEFAPEVIDHLMDMTGCEGRKVEFKCTIIGKPEPKITWYKDGDEIIPTRRTRLSYNDGVSSLFLSDLNLSDAGSYSCKAVNKFGHISTSSDLDIQEVRHRRKKKEGLDLESRYITYDDSHADPYSPPIIILPLVDEARNMGDNVDFNIKVRSRTPVEVTWRHYEDVILPSEKFKLKKDVDEFHLHISDLNLDDGGRWQCRAVNSYGQAETTCKLTVHNYTLEKYRVPEFTQELHNFVVSEGAEARFICKISAHPEPEVTWYKNRQPIENKGPYRFTQTSDDTFILVIDEVVREDIGYYMCQAVNTAGSKSTEAKLAVETVEKPLSLLERNPLQRGRIKSERFGSKKNKYAHAPEFTTKLKSKSVPAENTVKLSCTVSGVPEPDIQWYKNGEKIYSSLNCCMRNNSGLVSLEIAVAAHENEGQYVCEASNSEGTVSCSAQITVEGDKKPVADSSESEAPVFIETPLCSTVVIGGDAVFQCVTKGNPMPSFKWTKDGLNVDENDHCSLFVDSHGGCRLVVHNVQESDAGLYMCVAHNTMGRTKCSTRLRVVGQDEAHEHQGLSGTRATHHSHQKFEKIPDPDISNRMMMSGRPPYFTLMLPKLIELNEGDKLRLDCSLEGYPSPVVTWQKGVRELVYDARHRIIAYGTLQTLEIPSVLIMDHGEYFVRAANVFGIIESSCLVKVNKKGRKMAEREYNKMKFPASLPYDAADGDAPLQGDKEKPLVEPKGQAPFFIKHLPHTIDVIEGTDLRLDCSVKAKPKIEKSDIEGDYHRVEGGVTGEEKERGESRTLEPAGDMTSGHASAEVTSSTAAAAAVSSEEQTKKTDPSFTDKFDDTVVTEGEDAVLECKTSGDSDIRW